MPWSTKNKPDAFKNLTGEDLEKALKVANAVLADCQAKGGEDCEGKAIRIALASLKGSAVVFAEPISMAQIVENFRKNVRGVDISVDVSHQPDTGAVGWVRDLKVDKSSADPAKVALWAKVDWTEEGKELISTKKYRYPSVEIGPYVDPESGVVTPNVLFAFTLTNRPFLKGLQAIDANAEWVEILREGDFTYPPTGIVSITASEPGMEVKNMDKKMEKFLAENGITVADGQDIVEVLCLAYKQRDAQVVALTEQNSALTKQLEAKTQEADKASKELSAIKAEAAKEKRDALVKKFIAEGKLIPAQVNFFVELYDLSPEKAVRFVEEGIAHQVSGEKGTVSAEVQGDLEERRAKAISDAIRAGTDPVAAYRNAMRNIA